MLEKTRSKVRSTTNFVSRHRVAIAIVGTAATCLYLNRKALAQHTEFLKEHGLYNEFLLQGSTEEDRKAFYGE